MAKKHHKRTYTMVKGTRHVPNWKLVPQAAIANASGKLTKYLGELQDHLNKVQRDLLDVRIVEFPFMKVYQFGGNSVVENCVQYAEDPALVIDAISEKGLARLLAITELDRFEPKIKRTPREDKK